ncbi:unnamed protein product, partial [Prorocentrum cordatum]
ANARPSSDAVRATISRVLRGSVARMQAQEDARPSPEAVRAVISRALRGSVARVQAQEDARPSPDAVRATISRVLRGSVARMQAQADARPSPEAVRAVISLAVHGSVARVQAQEDARPSPDAVRATISRALRGSVARVQAQDTASQNRKSAVTMSRTFSQLFTDFSSQRAGMIRKLPGTTTWPPRRSGNRAMGTRTAKRCRRVLPAAAPLNQPGCPVARLTRPRSGSAPRRFPRGFWARPAAAGWRP